MSEATYTARANAKAAIIALAANVSIQRDGNGRFTRDAAERFKNLFILQLGACYNDTQPGEGMRKLADPGRNALTAIRSTDRVTADSVLDEAKRAAAKLKRETGIDEKPKFETRAEAKVEADDRNYAIQATIGTKEGAAEAIASIVGSAITDNVLKHADGTPKGVDEYFLAELFTAVSAAAKRPTEKDMLGIKLATLQYTFDWRKTFQQNMEQFRLQINKLTAYSLTCTTNEQVLVVLGNVHEASQHDFGRDFRETLRTIRQDYPHDHNHDDASLATILRKLTSADSLRDPADAPAPEGANAVLNSMALLSDFCQEVTAEYEEEALAASGSGSSSDSSRDKPRKARNNDKRRDKSSRTPDRARSKSRDTRKMVENYKDNPCKYCRKYHRLVVHQAKEADCYWNKKHKVFRPKRVCETMGIRWKPPQHFESDSEDDSDCE